MSHMRQQAKQVLESLGLLNPLKNAIFITDEWAHRFPNPWVKWKLESTTPLEMQPVVEALRHDGLVMLPNFIRGDRLQWMQESFHKMSNMIEAMPLELEPSLPSQSQDRYREQGYDRETVYTYDPFKYDRSFLEIALDEFILGIIARYFGKAFMLRWALATRRYSTTSENSGTAKWHYDGFGKQINVMVLLTDVTERDQYLSYTKGSHRIVYGYERSPPRSPRTVSSLWGSLATKSSAAANCKARLMSSSLAAGHAQSRLARTVSLNRKVSCATYPI